MWLPGCGYGFRTVSHAKRLTTKRRTHMRRNEGITAVLLVAALAAAACSKTEDTSRTMAPSEHSAQATPASMRNDLPAIPPADKGLDATATGPVGPVSFAHGEAAYQTRNYSEATSLFEHY